MVNRWLTTGQKAASPSPAALSEGRHRAGQPSRTRGRALFMGRTGAVTLMLPPVVRTPGPELQLFRSEIPAGGCRAADGGES